MKLKSIFEPHVEPFFPIWKRPPNKLLRYEDRRFTCGAYEGVKRVAIFQDRNGNEREEIAQVIWDDAY